MDDITSLHGALLRHMRQTLAKSELALTTLPLVPEISLYLFDPKVLQGPLTHEEAQAIMAEPAYWSFCWASGQVMARYILDNTSLVEGKTVLDFGSGSGVVAIACMLAGAKRAIACDIDPVAHWASRLNAWQNGVDLAYGDDWEALAKEADLLCAADVLYDWENRPLLPRFEKQFQEILLADSRVKDRNVIPYPYLFEMQSHTVPDLDESKEFNTVKLYRFLSSENRR